MPLDPISLKSLAIELSAALPPAAPPEPSERPLDLSPRAKNLRAIQRIADTYGWQSAIVRFLDRTAAAYLSDLNNRQVEELLDQMQRYVDAAEVGASLPECLPAN